MRNIRILSVLLCLYFYPLVLTDVLSLSPFYFIVFFLIKFRSWRLCMGCGPDGGGWCYQGWSSPAGTNGRRLVSSARWGLIPAAGASGRSDSGWSLEEEEWSEICIISRLDACLHANSFWGWFSGPGCSGRCSWYSPVTWATTAWEIRLFARNDLISSLITALSLLQAQGRIYC